MGNPFDAGEEIRLEVPASGGEGRLDRYLPVALAERGVELSRSLIQTLIREGGITVNGRKVKPRHAIVAGDVIGILRPADAAVELQAEKLEVSVLFEDDDLIVINKEEGMVVHPASGNHSGTLVNALLHHCSGKLSRLAGDDRPGIVHRLDKDTSGCLVAAKSDEAYHSLVAQFSARETRKEYIAVTNRIPTRLEGVIANRIGRHPVNRQKMAVVEPPGGKEAVTDFRVLKKCEEGSWASLCCLIHTGRTHQIRVHLKESLGCPILGDPIYGQISRQREQTGRLMLHAWKLTFRHFRTGEVLNFEAPLPEVFLRFL